MVFELFMSEKGVDFGQIGSETEGLFHFGLALSICVH